MCCTVFALISSYLVGVQAALGKIVCEPSEVQGLIQAGYLSQLAATRMHEALDIKEPQLVQLLRVSHDTDTSTY